MQKQTLNGRSITSVYLRYGTWLVPDVRYGYTTLCDPVVRVRLKNKEKKTAYFVLYYKRDNKRILCF